MVKKADLDYLLAKYLTAIASSTATIASSTGATTPHIYNITMTLANTEYSQALPNGTKKLIMKIRTEDGTFRVAWEAGRVATPVQPYLTVLDGGIYSEDAINLIGTTLYFASAVNTKVMEIVAWY